MIRFKCPDRIIGFLPIGCHVSPAEESLLRETFGFEELTIPEHGQIALPVEYKFFSIRGKPIAAGDNNLTLKRQGIWSNHLRNRLILQRARKLAATGKTLVMVEGNEHYRALRKLSSLRDNLTIVTGAGLVANPRDIAVIVRADAGTGLPPLSEGELAALTENRIKPLVLVDFLDRQHPALRRRSEQRRDAYRRAGWIPVGTNPKDSRVEDFIRNHLEGAK